MGARKRLGAEMTEELEVLLAKSVAQVAAMTPDERARLFAEQRAGYVRSEMSWPAPRFHYEGGAKVYESYEDYCNG